jgi:8-oxo-dGTP diphosphatase
MFTNNVKFFQKAIVRHPEDDRFLALQRSASDRSGPGDWDFPGGGVDFGELHLPALEREIWEETGLRVCAPAVLDMITRFDSVQQIYSIFVAYQAQATGTTITLSGEHSAYRWVTFDEWTTLNAPASLQQVVQVYAARNRS